jgi:phospholipid/cholesterol/gamma-HCH transport system substrate-binding protein
VSISSAQRTRLGVFFVIAITLTIIIFVSGIGLKLSEKTVIYYSEFKGESLSGLSKGMEVKFHGIPIGKVSNINYNPDDLTTVKVEFTVDETFPMKNDMVVETGMLGITGLKYVEIMGGTNDAELLPAGSLIESKPSLIASITDKIDNILIKADILLGNLGTITNPDSLTDIGDILSNVNSLTGNLDRIVTNSAPELEEMTKTLNSTFLQIEAMVTDFHKNSDLSKMMNDVDTTILSIKDLAENFNLTFTQSREDLSSTMINLQETMENLNNLSAILLENPSLILRGSPKQKRKIK